MKLPNSLTQKFSRQMLVYQKNQPTILFGAGVVGMVGSTVLACRATLKMQEIIDKTQTDLKTARSLKHLEYSETDRQKDVAVIYTRGTRDIVKLYAPATLLGVASIAALTKSHSMMKERNLALAAAYAAVDEAFKEYRARVVEKYGEEQDREFRYATEKVEVVDDDGKLETKTQIASEKPSMYARFFDEYSSAWSKEPEYNLVFLESQQSYANNMLKSRGHIFLNEVYDMLGIGRSRAGSVVVWIMTEDGSTDNYVDFGIWDGTRAARDFVNGREGSILLDFNVDGVIFDKIPDHRRKPIAWQS
jgi:hypothetical protein